jgi:pilus assembly protein CpaE
MDSTRQPNRPVIIILTRDKHLGELPDTLWSSGTDSLTVSHWAEARKTLESSQVCLAVVDGDMPDVELAQIRVELPGSHVRGVLWLMPAGSDLGRGLLLAPDSILFETVAKPVTAEELNYRLKAMLVRTGALPTKGTLAGPRARAEFGNRGGQVVAVFSTKGGVGKSFIAVNAAVGLARLFKEKVLLVDADLYYGDMLALLDASTQYTIADVCNRQMHDLDSLYAATTNHPTGISILPRPPAFERVELLNKEVLLDALNNYRRLFDHVIVNMSTPLDEFNLNVLEAAQRILLVTTPEIPAIQNTGRFIEIADKLGLTDRTSLILNRAASGVEKKALEERLGIPIEVSIRSSGRLVVQAANEGTSLFVKDSRIRQEITRDLVAVVEHVAGRPRPARTLLPGLPSFLRRAA